MVRSIFQRTLIILFLLLILYTVPQGLAQQENTFLAHALRHIKRAYRKIAGEEQKWIDEEANVEI